jgi:hypothetical protein
MSEATATKIFAIEDIILPLDYKATNVEHVHTLELLRERLLAFLKASDYCPNHVDTPNPNTFRENILANFAKLLLKEGLVDGAGELVTMYDACDFVAWLYHGFKWLNANVCAQYDKADGTPTPIMGFTKTVVDDVTIIKYTGFDRKTKATTTVDVPSKHTNVDWVSWSGPQMIDPLQLRLSPIVTSHKKALYGFFKPSTPKSGNGSALKTPKVATLADHVTAAIEAPKKPKAKKPKAPGVSGGGAGGST